MNGPGLETPDNLRVSIVVETNQPLSEGLSQLVHKNQFGVTVQCDCIMGNPTMLARAN